jgi:hypothetical protein
MFKLEASEEAAANTVWFILPGYKKDQKSYSHAKAYHIVAVHPPKN